MQTQSTKGSFGVAVLLVFLFLSYSRVADLFLSGLRIPLVTSLMALVATVVTGGMARAFSSRIALWLTAYSAWIVVAIPFSFWRGGSFQLLSDQWVKSFIVFFIVAGLLRTVSHCRQAMYTLGIAEIAILIAALTLGTTSLEGRLSLGQGVLGNSNDLAQVLLLCLPFLLLMFLASGSWLVRGIAAISMLGILALVGQTGSRGGLVTLVGMLLIVLLSVSWGVRVKLMAAAVVAAIIVLPYIPDDQWARYATILGDESETPNEAVGSTESRIELLKQSVALTLLNPIVGVGPGVFEPASARYSEQRGERAIWRVTHNTYTQVSSETGIPGLIFYLGTLFGCLRAARSIYKQSRHRVELSVVAHMSFCLWLSMVGFSISTIFSSVAYHIYLPTFAGLTVAFRLAAQHAIDAVESNAAPAASGLRAASSRRVVVGARPAVPV